MQIAFSIHRFQERETMSVATPSKVVTMADDTDFDDTAGYLTDLVVAPALCECAVVIAAVAAGAAVAACAGYLANAWAANRGHFGDQEHVELLGYTGVGSGSLADLIDARTEILR